MGTQRYNMGLLQDLGAVLQIHNEAGYLRPNFIKPAPSPTKIWDKLL